MVVEGMDLEELTQGVVKENEEKHRNGTAQETILRGVGVGDKCYCREWGGTAKG